MNKISKAFAIMVVIASVLGFSGSSAALAAQPQPVSGSSSISALLSIPVLVSKYVNPYTAEGQRMAAPKMGDNWSWFLVTLVTMLVLIIALLIMIQIKLNQFTEKQRAKEAKEDYFEKATWWEIFVKIEKDRPLDAPIEGHNYDGIVELDNNPPAWFNWLFFLPIITGVMYIMYYHVFNIGKLQVAEYEASVAEAEANMPEVKIDFASLTPLTDEADLQKGEQIFQANCAACHLKTGGGSVGPNLTDKYWLHGGDFPSIYKTIYGGVQGKGMAAWGEVLLSDDIHKVASYVVSLRNTNVEGGKAPEGEEYNP